jgi:hypothetical protein
VIFITYLLHTQKVKRINQKKGGMSWLWSYGSWIYNYICNQCLSPLMLWVQVLILTRCTTLNGKVCQWRDRSVVFSGYSGFLHQLNWLPWYIVESGIKHHKPIQSVPTKVVSLIPTSSEVYWNTTLCDKVLCRSICLVILSTIIIYFFHFQLEINDFWIMHYGNLHI